MTDAEFDFWFEKHGISGERIYKNDITYDLVIMNNGWIGIFEVHDVTYEHIPIIQVGSMQSVMSFVSFG